ncbi:hypothetical protein [uncultured Clostridium sp.]|uniref:hypothetical protein n=1 Tax=uncultured Clostridium sp. TaxID=59620 RepID=UPI00260790A9|nr:hypothetical protein [uncultured Clostridium sp.]
MNRYIYRIEHHFMYNTDEECLLIESDISPVEMQRIIVYISYRFNQLVCDTIPVWNFPMNKNHLLEILVKIYHVKNIKSNFNKILINATGTINEDVNPIDECYPTIFNNVYYIDIFDLWEFRGWDGPQWRDNLIPYLKNQEDEVDKLILDYDKYSYPSIKKLKCIEEEVKE